MHLAKQALLCLGHAGALFAVYCRHIAYLVSGIQGPHVWS